MTKNQLLKFIRIRNRSGFNTNLQFLLDLHEAGIAAKDLGNATRAEAGGYQWRTEHGLLVELPDGRMELRETPAAVAA
jgi:hypothetical protein